MGVKVQTLVLLTRWAQILCGVAGIIANIFGVSYQSADYYYNGGATIIYSAGAACNSYVVLAGAIGFWRFYRPQDLSWQLGLTIDWMGLILAGVALLIVVIAAPLSACWYSYLSCSVFIAGGILPGIAFFASFFPVIETLSLKKKGRLESRRKAAGLEDGKHDWFHMEESRSTNVRPQQSQAQAQPLQGVLEGDEDEVVAVPAEEGPK